MAQQTANKMAELFAAYEQDSNLEMDRIRVLIYGGSGTGKTYSLRTFRYPLWVDSFDPQGSIALQDLVKEGNAIIQNAYEDENPDKPKAFEAWDTAFTKQVQQGLFNHVGTYVLDSATTWASAALNVVLAKSGRPGGVPQQNDWYPQMVLMEKGLRRIMTLPCDIVFICHDDVVEDKILGSISRSPMMTGKLKKRIPLLFSEVYYAQARRTSKGTEYVWQMQRDAQNEARSRMQALPSAKGSKFETLELADFRALTKKFGVSYDNLPSFKELKTHE